MILRKGDAMRAISAADSVPVAIQRTRDFLFRPFNWGTYLKLGLVALITEGLGGNFQSSSLNRQPSGHGPVMNLPIDFTPERVAVAVFAALLAAIVCLF